MKHSAAENNQAGAAETQPNEQCPGSGNDRSLTPFLAALRGIGRGIGDESGHQEHDDPGAGEQGQKMIADGHSGEVHDEEQKAGARGVPRARRQR